MPLSRPQQIVRTAVANALKHGPVYPGPLAVKLWDEHRAEWADWTKGLCIGHVTTLIRKECKKALERVEDELFPGSPDHLPLAISVPAEVGFYYIALRKATIAEGLEAVDALTNQITADTRRRNALRDVLQHCVDSGGKPEDLIIDLLVAASAPI